MTKEEFATYLRALQAHDYTAIKQYYTDDYRAHFDGATFDRDGVIAVERKLACVADSSWDVLDVVADETGIAIHAILEMRFQKDAPPDFALGPFKAGKRIKTRFCGFYKLRGEQDLRVSRVPVPRRAPHVAATRPHAQSMTLPVPTRSWYVISSAGTQWICSSQRCAFAGFSRKRLTSLRHGSV